MYLLAVHASGWLSPQMAPAPMSRMRALTKGGEGFVTVVQTATNTVLTNVDVGFLTSPVGVAVTPDGTQVYVTTATDFVAVIATATNTVTNSVVTQRGTSGVAMKH